MSVRILPATRELIVDPAVTASAGIDWPRGRVPWDERATSVLRRLGWAVPPPITILYDWAGNTPFAHQRDIAAFCTLNPAGFVLADPGIGKTAAVLWAYDWLRKQGLVDLVLVVAPLSVLSVWQTECRRWTPHRTVVLVHGSAARRRDLLRTGADVFVINPDGLPVVEEAVHALVKGKRWVLVLDETTYYRNASSRRSRTVRRLRTAHPPSWTWGLTGTPMPERLEDAHGQIDLLYPGRAGRSLHVFRMRYMVKAGLFSWIARPGAVDEVAALFDPAIRLVRADCIDLPETMVQRVEVPMGARQAALYCKMVADLRADIDRVRSISAANQAVLMMKLLQIASGWVKVTDDDSVVALDNQAQREWVVDRVRANSRKTLVVNMFRAGVEGYRKALDEAGIPAETLAGDVPARRRAEIVERFQTDPTLRAIVLQPQAAAHGITLTAADSVIWTSAPLSNELYTQTNARIVRPGQTARTNVVHLIAAPVERRAFDAITRKQRLQDALLELLEGGE